MANRNDKNQGNIAGPFYVDSTCIDCGMCPASTPAFFRRNDELGLSIVYRQPATPDEAREAQEALAACPTESIGDDGERARSALEPRLR